jgi:hypothetical protein
VSGDNDGVLAESGVPVRVYSVLREPLGATARAPKPHAEHQPFISLFGNWRLLHLVSSA